MTTPVRASDARVSTFVKAEKINTSDKPDPAPRLIQPRDPRYNVEVGRFLRPLEKPVFRAIAEVWGGPTVLKMNASDQAAALREMWDSFPDPVAVGLDASRFDQHVSADALRWEHSVYLACFRGEERARLERLLSWQVNNKGRAFTPTARFDYETDGCRMSGDINTSLGNCLIMCAMVWAYCQGLGIKCRLANNGDDCVVVMTRADLPRFRAGLDNWFLEMGFTMKVEEPAYEFEHIEFCQTQPVWTPDGWLMVRNPNKAISKDLVSLLNLDQCFGAYCHAVGSCGLAAYGGIPIYQDFYSNLLSSGKITGLATDNNSVGRGLRYLSQGMSRTYASIHPRTRASFCFAFGITPDEQVLLEEFLSLNPLGPNPQQLLTPIAPVWYK